MWKMGLIGIAIVGGVASFAGGARLSAAVGGGDASKPLDVAKILADEAAKANKDKGKVTGHSTFVGAEARNGRLSYAYELSLNPRSVNVAGFKEDFYRKAVPTLCKSDTPLRRVIMQGATLEYSYRTATTKQHILAVELSAASCRG